MNRFEFLKSGRLIATIGMAMLLGSLSGCGFGEFRGSSSKHDADQLNGKLILTGSSTVAPLIGEIAARFEKRHPGVRVDVQTGGSSRGIRDAQTGAAQIGMSSRDLKTEEATKLKSPTIAWDGVAFVVHRDNPIEKLTNKQLLKIYLGQTGDWSQVGGKSGRIVVSSRAQGRSELDLICKYLNLDTANIKADVVDGETQQSIKTVSTNQNAITYTSIGAAQDAAERGEAIKLLPLEGVEAAAETVQTGDFPLARPLLLVVKDSNRDRLVKEFIEFASSSEVDDAVRGLGFVPAEK